jgi:uncharacterized membrane protein
MTAHALLFTFSCIGIAETFWLIKKRRAVEARRAAGDEVHSKVLLSRYNRLLFGIHNDVMGLLFYTASAALTALLVLGRGPLEWIYALEVAFVAGAVFMSLVFVYLMGRVLHYWCPWCLLSAYLTFAMGIIVLTSNLLILV